jgi:hypothetical protein
MGNPLSWWRRGDREGAPLAEGRPDHTKDDAAIRAHLEAYMQAFLGTEGEFVQEFEAAGVECWLNQDRADKR